ncbi:serine hydrolase [Rhodocytophaga rosea]|uniref:Serine hydrolase n=1 Tax=Rhodocytophaga rosea TaxID=2704465 RepID=A0A6C0GFJ2_9BACT|nr:serine hydrolase [Rhodocytophaga rosea]QHT66766.1 serine hydrolase [Rhodocytophaga rosea]
MKTTTLNRRDFLKQTGIGIAGLSLVTWFPGAYAHDLKKTSGLARSIPELQGLSSAQILSFIEAVEKANLGLHSLMIVRHGKVIAEGWWDPYRADLKHTLFSLSKSFTSTAIGFAVAEGKLTVEDKVVSFFPEEKPETVSENLAAMRIKDLLTMSTGHEKDTLGPLLGETQCCWVKRFLSLPVERKPGTHFLYNTGATYMLSAILQKVTNTHLLDYLIPRLFKPLGIQGADWEKDPDGIDTGGFGLRLATEDIAKFGQLYLQKGIWNGKQLLPATWIEEATSFQVDNAPPTGKTTEHDWNQGYGYQFWRCRHNAYRGDGAMGQYCIVMQEQDAVIAITSETHDMQAVMDKVWEILLPNMKNTALPQDSKAYDILKQKLASLTLLPASTNTTSPLIAAISGKRYKMKENTLHTDAVSFTFQKNNCTFKLKDAQGEHTIVCGLNQWIKAETMMPGDPPKLVPLKNKMDTSKVKVAAVGSWIDADTFMMTWNFYETPHSDVVTCHFSNDTLRMEFINSVDSKARNKKEPRLILEGQMEAMKG